jgi:hypothetical protein
LKTVFVIILFVNYVQKIVKLVTKMVNALQLVMKDNLLRMEIVKNVHILAKLAPKNQLIAKAVLMEWDFIRTSVQIVLRDWF